MTTIIGITGSIGMGKSTVARQFHALGAVVSDADAIVHQLMRPNGAAYTAIARKFPEMIEQGSINRQQLGRLVFANDVHLNWLEALLHPLVHKTHCALIRRAQYQRRHTLVLEVPLLFETGTETLCDIVCVVSCPAFLQRQRVLRRSGMNNERLAAVLAQQLPDSEKRRQADVVISTGLGRAVSYRAVQRVMQQVAAAPPHHITHHHPKAPS